MNSIQNAWKKQTITFSEYSRDTLENNVNKWLSANDYEVVATDYSVGVGFLGWEWKHYCNITFIPDSQYRKDIEDEEQEELLAEQERKEERRNTPLILKILQFRPIAFFILLSIILRK